VADDDVRTPGPGGDDDDTGNNRQSGVLVGVGLVIVIALIFMAAGAVYTQAASPPSPTTCSTSCLIFVKTECPGNRGMGMCFGYSVCSEPIHACGVDVRRHDAEPVPAFLAERKP
jgi:hypothetical protein